MPPEQQFPSQVTTPINPAPQSFAPQVVYGGFWIRFLALMLDNLVILVIVGIPVRIVYALIAASVDVESESKALQLWMVVLQMVLMYAYYIYFTNKDQATIGKRLLGLRVVSEDGTHLTLGRIIIRETVGKIASAVVLYIGYLMVAFTSKKQGLHDKIVGSVVVYNKAARQTWAFVLSIIIAVAVPVFVMLIMGIFAAFIITSLNTARTKGADVSVKSNISNIRAQAELVFDSNGQSYASVCGDQKVMEFLLAAEIAVGAKSTCNATATSYAVYSPLRFSSAPNSGWCVDSTGVARESIEIGMATVCP